MVDRTPRRHFNFAERPVELSPNVNNAEGVTIDIAGLMNCQKVCGEPAVLKSCQRLRRRSNGLQLAQAVRVSRLLLHAQLLCWSLIISAQ